MSIDSEKSYETFDPTTNNHTIFVHLLKDEPTFCPLCGAYENFYNRGSRSQFLKYASAIEDNINIKLFRRVYQCTKCNHYFKEKNPFLEDRRKISIQKDYKILESLKSTTATYSNVTKQYNVSPTYVINTFDKKIDLHRLELSDVICVDEVYSKKLSYHHYCFIIYNPRERKVIDVLDTRHLNQLENYFLNISKNERDKVKYFSIDLYDNYRILAKKCFKSALICADSFHVIKNLSQFFHKIRIKVMKKYSNLKSQNDNYYWLFKSYWKLLTKDQSKISYKKFRIGRTRQYMSGHEVIDYMLSLDKELKIAYELLHEYRNFNDSATSENAAEWFDEIVLKFQNSHIIEYIPAWKLLINWREEILNSFNRLNGYRISNGPIKRANRDIKTFFRVSFGSTNFTRTRNRIMYCMNNDSPILYTRKNTTNKQKGSHRGIYKK